MNFGFDFSQSNPCLFRPGQFIDLTSPVENTTYSPQYANNMIYSNTSAYGRENLGSVNQRAQFFQPQTSSNEQRTQKSEKKNKRKKNADPRRAIEKKNIQKRQQELKVKEQCQALLASINKGQNSTRTENSMGQKPLSGNAITLPEPSAKEALEPDGYQSELRQPQGVSAQENNKKIDIVSTTMANQDKPNSRKIRLMAWNKTKAIQSSSKKRRRKKDHEGIDSIISNAINSYEHIITTDMGNSVTSWNRADNQILDKSNEKDDVKSLQFSGILTNSPRVKKEKQKEQYSIPVLNHQEGINKKGKVLSHANPRKRQKKAAGPKSNSASFLNNTLTNEEENLNLLKNIPVIDLSSPVINKNVLPVTGGTNHTHLKKKKPVKSKEIQTSNTTTKDTIVNKSGRRPTSKKVKSRRRPKKIRERHASNLLASNDDNDSIKTGPDKTDILEQSRHGNKKMNQTVKEEQETHEEQERHIEEEKHEEQKEKEKCEAQEPHVEQEKHEEQEKQDKNEAQEQHVEEKNSELISKRIPGYIEPYKTDTEKEVLSLMRELLGIVK